MALGTVTSLGDLVAIELLASATATNSVPSGTSAGLSVQDDIKPAFGGVVPDLMTLSLVSTAGSATMTVTARMWGFLAAAAVWVPVGTGPDATKGVINGGVAIGETGADLIRHSETVAYLGHFQRVYLEITAIGGTSTAVTARLNARMNYPRAL
jgi:hypothetical protein